MPWFKNKNIRKREFVLCKVEQVEVLFPSERSLNLIRLYGSDSTEVTQTPHMIQRLTLSVCQLHGGGSQNSLRFQVDIFPNQLPDFLIPQCVFETKYEKYMSAVRSNTLVGHTYKVASKTLEGGHSGMQTVRIVADACPLEPTLFPMSLWRNIKCVPTTANRNGMGSVSQMP